MTWTALPAGEAVDLLPGQLYAVVASVKTSHAAADVRAFAASHGLTLLDYAEQGQRAGLGPDPRSPDYRYIAAIASAGAAGTLPWNVPWPLSMVDDSGLVSAWTTPAQSANESPPAPPAPGARPKGFTLGPLLTIAAGFGAFAIWHRRRKRR
jgi:hypothetical protein